MTQLAWSHPDWQNLPTGGFRPGLTAGGQNGGAYRHITAAAGSTLVFPPTFAFQSAVDLTEYFSHRGSREDIAEILGNVAGFRAALSMGLASSTHNFEGAKRDITRTICSGSSK
jgi:hypothetical protein